MGVTWSSIHGRKNYFCLCCLVIILSIKTFSEDNCIAGAAISCDGCNYFVQILVINISRDTDRGEANFTEKAHFFDDFSKRIWNMDIYFFQFYF